ncbi:MAG: 50S ribosomal protein L25 [Candidatus Pacebacteria bacterium]|nr:50S ribosomal protein L25 [Candidatus Paceibacterota bacterium]
MISLIAYTRSTLGKKVRELFEQGIIPAQLYGHRVENMSIQVPVKEFTKVFKTAGQSSVITLVVDGTEFPVLIHDVQYDAINQRVAHIDFYKVNMSEKITAQVPLSFVGEAPAIRGQGGVLVKAVEELEVEALPADLPHEIVVDVTVLKEIHQSIHVSDLVVEKGVKINADSHTTVATVIEPAKEEEPAPQPEAVTPEGESQTPPEETQGDKSEEK